MDPSFYECVLEELNCPICLSILNNPHMLSCHHTFCADCISVFFKYSKRRLRWKLICPLCRVLTIVSCGNGESPTTFLLKNFIASGLVGKIANHVSPSVKTPFSLDSPVNGKDENESEKVYCKSHLKNVVKYYCKNCRCLICRVCTIMNHREHDLVFPHEVIISQQDQLESDLEKMQSNQQRLEIALSTLQVTVGEIRAREAEILGQIDKEIELRRKTLLEKKTFLEENLRKIIHGKLKKLSVQNDLLELEFGKGKFILNAASAALNSGSPVEKLSLKSTMEQHLKTFKELPLEPEEDDTIIYEINDNAVRWYFYLKLENLIGSVGTVFAKSTFADISYAHGTALEVARLDDEAQFTVVTCSKLGHVNVDSDLLSVKIKTPDDSLLDSIANKNESGDYLVTFVPKIRGKHKIHVCLRGRPIQNSPFICNVVSNRDYYEIKQFRLTFGIYGSGATEFKSPLGITSDNNGFIYVSDCFNHRLQVFNVKGDYIFTYGQQGCRKGCLSSPSGLAYHLKKNQLFVCDTGNSRIQLLQVTDPSSDFTVNNSWRSFKFGNDLTSSTALKSPSGIAISSLTDDLVVCDPGLNCIQLYNCEGTFLSRIAGLNSQQRLKSDARYMLNSPSHAAFDPEKNQLYVSDTKNNRILIYDRRINSCIRKIESTKNMQLSHPKGLAFDQGNNLLIVNSGLNLITVLNLNGGPVQTIGGSNNTSIKFSSPEAVCVLKNGGLAITDCCNNRIVVV